MSSLLFVALRTLQFLTLPTQAEENTCPLFMRSSSTEPWQLIHTYAERSPWARPRPKHFTRIDSLSPHTDSRKWFLLLPRNCRWGTRGPEPLTLVSLRRSCDPTSRSTTFPGGQCLHVAHRNSKRPTRLHSTFPNSS